MRNTASTYEMPTQQGFMRVWTNVDTRLTLSIVETDNTRTATDITNLLGPLVACGLGLVPNTPSASAATRNTSDSGAQESASPEESPVEESPVEESPVEESPVEESLVELGSLDLTGGCRVLLDGHRLHDQDILELVGAAVVEAVTRATHEVLHKDPTPE